MVRLRLREVALLKRHKDVDYINSSSNNDNISRIGYQDAALIRSRKRRLRYQGSAQICAIGDGHC